MKVDIKINISLLWCFVLFNIACCKSPDKTERFPLTKGTFALISVSANNDFYFNNEKVSSADIEQKISDYFDSKKIKDKIVYLDADPSIKYGTTVSVLSAIRENNINRVQLIAGKDKGGNPLKLIEAEISRKLPPPDIIINTPPTDWIFITLTSESALGQKIKINATPVTLSKFTELFEDIYKRRLDKSLYIGAATEQSYGDFLELVKYVEELGAKPIILRLEYLNEDIPPRR